MDKRWIEKLKEYCENGSAGTCPICGSNDFFVETYNHGRSSVTFSCENCGVNQHFDGIRDLSASHG